MKGSRPESVVEGACSLGAPLHRSCTPLGPCLPSHRETPRILGREGFRSLLSDLSDIMLSGSAFATVSNFKFVCYRPNCSRVWSPSLEFVWFRSVRCARFSSVTHHLPCSAGDVTALPRALLRMLVACFALLITPYYKTIFTPWLLVKRRDLIMYTRECRQLPRGERAP